MKNEFLNSYVQEIIKNLEIVNFAESCYCKHGEAAFLLVLLRILLSIKCELQFAKVNEKYTTEKWYYLQFHSEIISSDFVVLLD